MGTSIAMAGGSLADGQTKSLQHEWRYVGLHSKQNAACSL